MPLRELLTREDSAPTETKKSLVKLIVTEASEIYAVWSVEKGGKHREFTVPVSPDVLAAIRARPEVQQLVDDIVADTAERAIL